MNRLLLTAAIASLPATMTLAAEPTLAIPEIAITHEDDAFAIVATVDGLAEGVVNAIMTIDKADANGRVKSRQGGEITVTPGSSDVVAQTTLSTLPGGTLHVTLTLSSGGAQIATASTMLGPQTD